MNRKPNQPFAVIDFGRTKYTCMDVTCPCGGDVHVHGALDRNESSEYVRCPWCKDVLRVGSDVNLLSEREDFKVNVGTHVYLQWKGTDVVMTAHCTCQKTFEVAKDFAYECDCPHCGAHYHCESRLEVTKLTAEEAAAVVNVNEPDKDYEDMDETERAAYEEKYGLRPAALSAVELGHLVDPGRSFLDYARDLPGKPLAWPAPGVAVIVVGDAVDLFAVSRWPGNAVAAEVVKHADSASAAPGSLTVIHGHRHRLAGEK